MRRIERRLRLATGLVIACFIVGHFVNHSLGVVSVDAMDRLRAVLAAWWRSAPGTVVLYGALLTHFALALVSLYRRTTLRMPTWEAAQIVLGLAIPPLLISHIVGTRLTWFLLEHNIAYHRVVGVLWSDSWTALRQSALLLIVWTHLCFGIHYWLRIKRWYPAARPGLVAAALLIPSLALAGFAAAGNEIWPRIEGAGGLQVFYPELGRLSAPQRTRLADWRQGSGPGFWPLPRPPLPPACRGTATGGPYRFAMPPGPGSARP